MFRNMIRFYGEELLAPRPTPKLEDHTLSAVSDCLFNIFAATLHIGCRSSISNLRTRHAFVTGAHLSWNKKITIMKFWKRISNFSVWNEIPVTRRGGRIQAFHRSCKDCCGLEGSGWFEPWWM